MPDNCVLTPRDPLLLNLPDHGRMRIRSRCFAACAASCYQPTLPTVSLPFSFSFLFLSLYFFHIVHQPKKSGSRRFCDFLKRERKVQSHAGLDSAENSTFPHSGATLREAGRPLRHGIVGSDPQLPADVGDGRRLPIQAGRHHDDCFAGDVRPICM